MQYFIATRVHVLVLKYTFYRVLSSWRVVYLFKSTPPSRPNTVGLKCPYVRPSTKSFFDFNEIWYVGRGRWVIHDGMQYDSIQCQGQPLKVGSSAIFKGCLLPYLWWGLTNDHRFLKWVGAIPKAYWGRIFFIFVLVFVSHDFEVGGR